MTDTALEKANRQQREAANPSGTRLVVANAGSGKTKVLVDRVSRLLLGGAAPDKILCLTYTKAAAAEMQRRLFDKLGTWSVMSEADLNAELDKLLGERKERSARKLGEARQLFAKALETPEGLKIQTIHAFCERVLGRFPIEAGIFPGFEPIDEADRADLLSDIITDSLKAAQRDPLGDLAQSIGTLSALMANQTLDEVMTGLINRAKDVQLWAEAGGLAPLSEFLNVPVDITPDRQKAHAWTDGPLNKIRAIASSLLSSPNKTDVALGEKILACFDLDPAAAFEAYAAAVLKADGGIRASTVTAKAPDAAIDFYGNKASGPGAETLRIFEAAEWIKAARVMQLTSACFIIARDVTARYEALKLRRRLLDFNDLIERVRKLVNASHVSAWIRYKLDGGIDHILIDEAQDTSPDQWDIIDALHSGLQPVGEAREEPRTFFAVGDEKQSIYRFQGAQPEQFLSRIQRYVGDDPEAKSVDMQTSFRSAKDVLLAVDAVFETLRMIEHMFNPDEVPGVADVVKHVPFREDSGLVELWPLTPHPEEPEEEVPWDTTPVDSLGQASSREKLALQIAQQVDGWLKSETPIFDRELKRTRAMRAGDVLILVQRRNAFFDAIIRNLKKAGVNVAGADRLVLREAIVVKDLLSLTRFVLLPSDDLSLAEVLKSPLIGWDEDQLFDLAHGRGGTLWSALSSRGGPEADLLNAILKLSRKCTPYEFYTRVLDLTDGEGRHLKAKVYGRLSMEAQDALEAFLAQALSHQRRRTPSLMHFLHEFSRSEQDIKRELDSGDDEVRVMTVHGSKGLEAPVVILPDTTQIPGYRSSSGLAKFENGFVYLPRSSDMPESLAPLTEAEKTRTFEEYLRLLYVAMTRAESRLVICGFASGHRNGAGFTENSWYDILQQAMDTLKARTIETDFGEVRQFGSLPEPYALGGSETAMSKVKLPGWIDQPAAKPAPPHRTLSPSGLMEMDADVPVRSPLTVSPDRFLRGNVTHKLLEILPDIEAANRAAAADAYLDKQAGLSPEMRADIHREVFAVLEDPDFAPLFGPGSTAEMTLAGRPKGFPDDISLSGQIDRIAVTDKTVYIIDYKSNRPPPQDPAEVSRIYWAQMAAYRAMAAELYPGREINCALLWTDGPRLMWLDSKRLDDILTELTGLPT